MTPAQTDIVHLANRFGVSPLEAPGDSAGAEPAAGRVVGTRPQHGSTAAASGRLAAGESEAATKNPSTGSAWTNYHQQAFSALAPAAVYVAGNDGPEPRFFGDNMGAWPILLGITRTWRDTITPQMDRFSPHRSRGVMFRVWTPGMAEAKRLLAGIEGLIKDRVDQLHGSWLDFGPNTDLQIFEAECHEVARRMGIAPTWDDPDLWRRVDRDAAEMEAKSNVVAAAWAKGRGRA